jgi:protein tyrosine/serine phosphatase
MLHDDDDMLGDTGLRYFELKSNAWHPEEEDVVRFLQIVRDPANQPVFVHCQHGSDRTGMMVAAYRMTVQNWDAADAMAELPNFGFHPAFDDIKKYLAKFDVQRVMKKVEALPKSK